ncbi:hypothetical protein [Enterovibrio calviensis]|uniref:hypothetical protein n=1 Tax=Enterovibrio calviensis TaxID=91359 RepID=UPI000485FC0F|nr:hypothetical protein [Enterovibrio calviensis]
MKTNPARQTTSATMRSAGLIPFPQQGKSRSLKEEDDFYTTYGSDEICAFYGLTKALGMTTENTIRWIKRVCGQRAEKRDSDEQRLSVKPARSSKSS